ncbi:HesB/YadR/YfhF family protein [Bacillus tuaregi]|uniref:HesB/YadR/YfhF family protein n=1 Tax=Bacillus tuaregi TaxID=1816695 RepID=UPI0008F932A4|nr:HesB/YadR/YfhF family protein [Bacillus tuaregi]
MQMVIHDTALKWFKEEMGLEAGEKVKFFAKIYGSSPVQENYTLGFTRDNEPIDVGVSVEKDGIVFYVEASDIWYFDGHDLHVHYNEAIDEVEFEYIKP